MLYLSITFDYELFMGENYTNERQVLIEPTTLICNNLLDAGVSGVFFADICCAMQYREMGESEFPNLMDEQLRTLTRLGQDVQLHIHPNWLKASEIGRHIEFERRYYRLHNWEEERPGSMREIIHGGIDYINQLLKPDYPDYHCVAYRAGGYCMQPEGKLAQILFDEGIRIDSSICVGFSHDGDGMYYNYRGLRANENFFFNRNFPIVEQHSERLIDGLFEVPVASYGTFPFRVMASKLNSRISEEVAKGCGMKLKPVEHYQSNKLIRRIDNTLHAYNMVTFDFHNAASMQYMINRIFREKKCETQDIFISTIAHPKGMTVAHIDNMMRTITNLQKNPYIKFVNMQDIAKIVF